MKSHEQGVGRDSEMEEGGRERELNVAESEDGSLRRRGCVGMGGDVAGFELIDIEDLSPRREEERQEGGGGKDGELRPLPFPSLPSSILCRLTDSIPPPLGTPYSSSSSSSEYTVSSNPS